VGDEVREDVDVVVDGERIAEIVAHGAPLTTDADTSARPATRIEGHGRTLLPGLIDAHAHYTFDPTEGSIAAIARRSDAEIVLAAAGHAALALRAGVTTARGAGSIRNLEVVLRDAIAAGHVPGPRLVVAEVVPGVAVAAVVLADGSPLALGEVRPPALPRDVALARLVQPPLLGHIAGLAGRR
jgi:imidazolonepropionase-like amidohydrolase